MVGGRQVLLSIAVLSGLVVENVCGGLLGRQDGVVDSIQSATSGGSASTSGEATAAVANASISASDSAGSSPSGDATSSDLGLDVSTSTGTTDPAIPIQTSVSVAPDSTPDNGTPAGEIGTSSTSTRVPPIRVPPTRATSTIPTSVDNVSTYDGSQAASETTTAQTTTTTPLRGGPPGGGPPKLSTTVVTVNKTTSFDLGYNPTPSSESDGPTQTTFVTSTRSLSYSPSESVTYCEASDFATSWSVIYSSTITWYGNPSDYTPPYPTLSVPTATSSCVLPLFSSELTVSFCTLTGTDTKYVTCDVTTSTESWGFGIQTTAPNPVTFVTTDKNPAVVYSTIRTPNYGVSQEPKSNDNHASPTGTGDISNPAYNSQNPSKGVIESAQLPTSTPVTVAVQPTAVVINGNTIRDNPSDPTQVVIIAGQTFTIDPTRVIGADATIDRPSATGGIFIPNPTTTSLGGVPVVLSSSVAIIGTSTVTLGLPTPTTITISSQTITIGPSAITINSQTLTLPHLPSPTEIVVAGGELITAINHSLLIVHGTTFTLPASPTTSLITIDDDTLTLGPSGIVTAHNGALILSGTGTQFALVGGATITKVGASVVVIKEVTYTVGPGTGTTTTRVGGETITIGPGGVEVGTTLSLAWPFGPTTVLLPGGASSAAAATATGMSGGGSGSGSAVGGGKEEKDAASAGVRPWLVGVVVGLGIALGFGLV